MAEEAATPAEGKAPETVVEKPAESQQPIEEGAKPEESGPETKPEAKPEGKPDAVIPEWRFKQEYKAKKELERENAELKAKVNSKPAESQPLQNEPVWEDYEAQGKTVTDFNKDYLDFHYDSKRAKEKEQETAQTQQSEWNDRTMKATLNYQTKSQSARANHQDYDAKIQEAQSIGIGFAPAINLLIDESENAGELRYHLSTNHEAAYKLMSLPIDKAILKLGSIAGKLPTGKSQPVNMTNTEQPPEPLHGGGKAPTKWREGGTLAEFKAMFPRPN